MDQGTIRIIAGVLCVLLVVAIFMRRKSKSTKVDDDF